MKHVGKGPFSVDGGAVELEFPGGRRGNYINLSAWMGGMIGGTENLPHSVIGGGQAWARDDDGNAKKQAGFRLRRHERMRTNERLICEILPVPAIPISAASSPRRISMMRTTPFCPKAASPHR